MAPTVLVAFATKHGSTTAIASAIGSKLHAAGLVTRVLPAVVVRNVTDYDAVVLGSALYHEQWLWDAHRFLRRVRGQLRERPVWLFSSGPIGDTTHGEPVVGGACGLDTAVPDSLGASLRDLDVCGHATFGGKVSPRVAGLEQWVPRGDWRDFGQVRSWARTIGEQVPALTAPARRTRLGRG